MCCHDSLSTCMAAAQANLRVLVYHPSPAACSVGAAACHSNGSTGLHCPCLSWHQTCCCCCLDAPAAAPTAAGNIHNRMSTPPNHTSVNMVALAPLVPYTASAQAAAALTPCPVHTWLPCWCVPLAACFRSCKHTSKPSAAQLRANHQHAWLPPGAGLWPHLPGFQVCCLLLPSLLLQQVPHFLSLLAAAAAQQHTCGLLLTAARRLLLWLCCACLLQRRCAGYDERRWASTANLTQTGERK